tara:strand:+ start:1239 stop:1655 length:417 start_codon:yes stop_codon:yes gene_type:complete
MRTFFAKISIITILFGCEPQSPFPNTYVNIAIPINMPEYNNLTIPLGYEYIIGGLGGIIILRDLDNNFIAYDRACTYEMDADCIITGESTTYDAILHCGNCCESKFIVVDGSVTEGPANQALKRYNTSLNGEVLYITN